MENPWKSIKLSDYENHMKSDAVMQLQTLNCMMKEQLNTFPAHSAMILGIAGGNGLEHICTRQYRTVMRSISTLHTCWKSRKDSQT